MVKKDDYGELKQRIKDLEEELALQKQPYEELHESEKKFRLLAESANDVIWIRDMDLNLIYVSPSVEKTRGFTPEEVMAQGLEEVLTAESAKRVAETFQNIDELEKKGEGLRERHIVELEHRCKDGSTIWLECCLSFLRDSEGNPTGILGVGRDIRERKVAEDMLESQNRLMSTLLDNLQVGVFMVEAPSGRPLLANKRAEALLGRGPDNDVDKATLAKVYKAYKAGTDEFYPQDQMPVVRAMSGESTKVDDMVVVRPDGTRVLLEVFGSPVRDREGNVIASLVSFADITERKRKEHELSQIFRMSLDMLCVADLSTSTFIKVNPAFIETLGFSEEELLGRPFLDFIHPEDVAPTEKVVEEELLRGKKVINFKNRYRCKDGTYRWLNWLSHPAIEQGVTYAVAHDITKEKEAEEALQESEKRYRSLVENTLDGYCICEIPSTRFIFLNQRICELAGYTMEEALGLTIWDVIDPDEHQLVMERIQERTEGRASAHASNIYSAIRKDGSKFRAEVSTSLVTYQGKRVLQGVLRDVTEQEKLQTQFQQAQKMEAIGTLAGGIAHDFNNLLMGIQGRASLMMMELEPSHPLFEHLRGVEDYVKSATELTKQLLGFARAGKYEVKPTDLNDLILKSSQMFGRTKKEISIHPKFQEDLWTVETDQMQIEQVLLNMYVNAWQAMPAGGELYIQTQNMILDEDYAKTHFVRAGKYVKISITDTGLGMDENTKKKIFDPFFTTKEMGRGTGLGLASAYGIIKNHDGLINVYSEKGEGTTFNIYLPATEKELIEEKESVMEILKGSETVLLVDDEQMVIDVGAPMLEGLGYKVMAASSGRAALEIYQEEMEEIGVVILDMIMPEMNGGETYDRLKEMNPRIKVLLSSGYSINGKAQDILERGCDGFIQKPFSLNELSQKLREILDKD